MDGWKGAWILNPDTEPEAGALAALVGRAELGGKGMVGSTILEAGSDDVVRFRGGLHWQRFAARSIAIGLHESIGAPFDLCAVENAMDGPSGASMYVTRKCLDQVGLMDESYFLFFEDLDWGVRAKKLGLGYASTSIVAHQRGTTTGSAGGLAAMSKLAVYLQHRNGIHFVRRHFPWSLPVRIAVSILHAFRFLIHRAPGNFLATLEGVLAGLKGETGQPDWHRKPL
jgi:N-acetylglucosaminyl-diphospho-decaprenol L-rhamnosyltransferase